MNNTVPIHISEHVLSKLFLDNARTYNNDMAMSSLTDTQAWKSQTHNNKMDYIFMLKHALSKPFLDNARTYNNGMAMSSLTATQGWKSTVSES